MWRCDMKRAAMTQLAAEIHRRNQAAARSWRHPDRNAGGGDHHRAVCGVGRPRACSSKAERPASRRRAPDQILHDRAGHLQARHRHVSHHRAGPAGAARQARRRRPVERSLYAARTSRKIPGGTPTSTSIPASTATSRTSSRSARTASPEGKASMRTLLAGATSSPAFSFHKRTVSKSL